MSRARNIKPGFFKNELLAELAPEFRLLFIGIWCESDREGRLEYRPRRLKAEIFPYDDVDIDSGVASLMERNFLHIYEVSDRVFIQVHNWGKHQNPHHKEVASVIPAPAGHVDTVCTGYVPLNNAIRARIYARDGRVCRYCGAVTGLSVDHIKPISKGGNSTDDNLQVLCLTCNARKGNRISSMTNAQPMHESSTQEAGVNQSASCPTDSGYLIPDTSSKASASPANEPAAADPIWGTGLDFLKRKGLREPPARAFLGLLRKELHDDLTVAELLGEAERQDVSNPQAWLSAAAKARKRQAQPRAGPTGFTSQRGQAIEMIERMKRGLNQPDLDPDATVVVSRA